MAVLSQGPSGQNPLPSTPPSYPGPTTGGTPAPTPKFGDGADPNGTVNPGGANKGTVTVPNDPGINPTPGTITVGGYTPDTQKLIESDPGYQAWSQGATQQQQDAQTQRQAAIRQAVIQYGGLPANFQDQFGDVDQNTINSAQNNQYSTLAQLANNYAASNRQFLAGLAARGMLSSGDFNYGADQMSRDYGQQLYDAANTFGSGISGAENAYTGTLGQIASGRVGAVTGAEANIESNPAYAPVAGQTLNLDAGASAKYGQPLYGDGKGNYWTLTGQAFTVPTPNTAPTSSAYPGPSGAPTGPGAQV